MGLTADDAVADFLRLNPDVIVNLRTLQDATLLDELNWGGHERQSLLETLGGIARLASVEADPSRAQALLLAGYDSASAILHEGAAAFVSRMQDAMGAKAAWAAYNRAKAVRSRTLHQWMRAREAASPYQRMLSRQTRIGSGGQAAPPAVAPGLSVNYATIFGEAPFADVPHDASILGPGAYFVDLMALVQRTITEANPDQGPLSLRSRRPDLWNMLLTTDTATGLVSNAKLALEILESTATEFDPNGSAFVAPLVPPGAPGKLQTPSGWPASFQSGVNYILDAGGAQIAVSGAPIAQSVTLRAGRGFQTLVIGADPIVIGALGSTSPSPVVVLEGFVIGFAPDATATSLVQIAAGSLTLRNCVLTASARATLPSGWALSGLPRSNGASASGVVILDHCTFIDESSTPQGVMIDLGGSGPLTLSASDSILWSTYDADGAIAIELGQTAVANLDYCDVRGGARAITAAGAPATGRLNYADTCFDEPPQFVAASKIPNTILGRASPCVGRGRGGRDVGASYSVYDALTWAIYPFDLPCDLDFDTAQLALDALNIDLGQVDLVGGELLPAASQNPYFALSELGLSIADYLILSSAPPADLSPYYGLPPGGLPGEAVAISPASPNGAYAFPAATFATWLGLTVDELRSLIYQDLGPSEIAQGVQSGGGGAGLTGWSGFYVNGWGDVSCNSLALRTEYVPVGRYALQLGDGAGASFPALASPPTGAFTVTFWVFADGPQQADILMIEDGDESLSFFLDQGLFGLRYANGANEQRQTVDVSAFLAHPQWLNLALVYDDAALSITLYVNGQSTGAALTAPIVWPAGSMLLAPSDDPNGGFAGAICDLAVWGAPLTAEDIAAGFQQPTMSAPAVGRTPPPTGLIAYWPLNDEAAELANWSSAGELDVGVVTVRPSWRIVGLPRQPVAPSAIATQQGLAFVQMELLTGTGAAAQGATHGNLDRINRFARLARRMDWTPADLEWALFTAARFCAPLPSEAGTLPILTQLARLQFIQAQTQMDMATVCAFFGRLKPFGRGRLGDQLAPFDQVFNPAPLSATIFSLDMALQQSIASDFLTPGDISRRLAEVLDLELAGLARIAARLAQGDELTLDGTTLTGLYAWRALAGWVGLDVDSFLDLVDFTGLTTNPAGGMSPASLCGFIRATAWIAGAFQPSELRFLTAPDLPENPYQKEVSVHIREQLPKTRAALAQGLGAWRITAAAFMSPLVGPAQSQAIYDEAVQKGYVDPDTGLITSALWAELPTAPYRAPSAAYKTIGEAVQAAVKSLENGLPAATVMIAPGYYAAADAYGIAVNLAKGVLTIQSEAGPEATVVDCGGHDRFLNLASAAGAQVIVSGLTVQGGAPGDAQGGGAILSLGGLRLVNCIFRSNTAPNGGAVLVVGPGPTTSPSFEAQSCVFYNNSTGGGGGALNLAGVSGVLQSCTLFGNTSTNHQGDGVFLDSQSSLTIEGSIAWDDPGNTRFDWSGGSVVCSYSNTNNPNPGTPLGEGCISETPLLVGPADGLFGLQPGSPGVLAAQGQDMGYGGSVGDYTLIARLTPPALGQAAVLSAQIAQYFGGGDQPVDAVLTVLGPYQNGLQILTAEGQDEGLAVAYVKTVFLYLLLCARFGVGGDTFAKIIASPGLLSLTGVVSEKPGPWLPTPEDLRTLAQFAALRGQFVDIETPLLTFLADIEGQTPRRVCDLFGWDQATFEPLLAACQIQDWLTAASTTTPAYISATSLASAAPYGGDLTLETWISTNAPLQPEGSSAASNLLIASHHVAGDSAFWLGFANDSAGAWRLTFQVWAPDGQVATVAWPDAIEPETWRHVAAVFAAGTLTLYLDGQPCEPVSAGFGVVGWVAGDILLLGQDDVAGADASGLTNGLAEVRLWSVARTQAQILANRQRHVSPHDCDMSNLFGYWTFAGGAITDLTGRWIDPVASAGVSLSQGAGGPVPVTLRAILTAADGVAFVESSGLDADLVLALYRDGLIFGAGGADPLTEALAAKDGEAAAALNASVIALKRDLLKRFAMPAINAMTGPLGFPVVTENDLSDFLLLDVKMGVETTTSPVLQASLSLQQYVQRCRLGLEPRVSTVAMTEREWSWSSAYRSWEANRKVFLYPETYLRPELRKDKTPLFAELEHNLAGAATTKAGLESLFRRYLDQFAVLSTLKTVGCWYEPAERVNSYVAVDSTRANAWLTSFPLQQSPGRQIGAFSIEGWVRTTGADDRPDANWFIGYTTDGLAGLAFGLGRDPTTGQPTFYVQQGSITSQTLVGANVAFGAGRWVHLCGVFDEGEMILYADGRRCGSATASFNSIWLVDGFGLVAGHQPNSSDLGCVNDVAEVRLWNTVRTQEQILADMSRRIQTSDPSFTSLAGYWTFDNGSPNEVTGQWKGWIANGPAGSISYQTAPGDLIDTTPEALDAYHFIGRTGHAPYGYYHRVKEIHALGGVETAVWRAWEAIGLTIDSPFVTPVMVGGRLYIFWVEWLLNEANPNADPPAPAGYSVRIKYSWRNADGSWIAPQAPFPTIEIPGNTDFAQTRRQKVYATPVVAEGATAVMVMYYSSDFGSPPTCFLLNWDQSITADLLLDAATQVFRPYAKLEVLPATRTGGAAASELVAFSGLSFLVANELSQGNESTYQQQGIMVVAAPAPSISSDFSQGAHTFIFNNLLYGTHGATSAEFGNSDYSKSLLGMGSLVYFQNAFWFALLEDLTDGPGTVVALYMSYEGWFQENTAVSRNIIGKIINNSNDDASISLVEWNNSIYAAVSTVDSIEIYYSGAGQLASDTPWSFSHQILGGQTRAKLAVGEDGNLHCLAIDGANIWITTCSAAGAWSAPTLTNIGMADILSDVVSWNGAWYLVSAPQAGKPLALWSNPDLDSAGGWTQISTIDDYCGGPSPVALAATAIGLQCFFADSDKTLKQARWKPAWGKWLIDGNFPQSCVPSMTPELTPWPELAPAAPRTLLQSGPPTAYAAPIGNQLAAHIFAASGPEFLVEAVDPTTSRRWNAQVIAGLDAAGEISLAGVTAPQLLKARFAFERLTTTTAPALSKALAMGGVDALLSIASQRLQESPFAAAFNPDLEEVIPPSDLGVQFRLGHPFGLYYREIFFFIPWLIAQKLARNNQFEDARTYLEYIFKPSAASLGEDYWRCAWLQSVAPVEALQSLEDIDPAALALYWEDPFDATAIADLRLSAYQRAIVTAYVQNLVDWGDSLFSANTRESINQAEQLYRYAADLLGPRPKQVAYTPPPPETYGQLSAQGENPFLIGLEQVGSDDGESAPSPMPEGQDPNGSIAGNGFYFGVPDNETFLANWDRVEDRLYKIRHGLDLSGAPDDLPLFEPPLSLDQILAAGRTGRGPGVAGSATAADAKEILRFPDFLFAARMLANSVIEFGASLQRALELKDSEGLAVLQASQQSAITERIKAMRTEEVNAVVANLTSTQAALAAAQFRSEFYKGLLAEGLTPDETAGVATATMAITPRALASALNAVATSLYPVPTIFGTSVGGQSPGHALQAAALAASEASGAYTELSGLANTLASYNRRAQEWRLQRSQADYDVKQITAQILAAQRQMNAMQQQYAIDAAGMENSRAVEAYFRDKFANGELYEWMADTLGQLYYALYQVALSVAQMAQATLAAFTGTDQTYISTDAWDGRRRGLLAGESLLLGLARLEQAYLQTESSPKDEATKTISLRRIDPRAYLDLVTTGTCVFELSEALFDRDHPGHYQRIVRTLSVQIDGLSADDGDGLNGALTRVSHNLVRQPDAGAVRFLLGSARDHAGGSLLRGLRPRRSALAHRRGGGQANFDSGELSAFAGGGAVSRWRLDLPLDRNRADLAAITDVTIKLGYEARYGGDDFRREVEAALPPYQGGLLVKLEAAGPDGRFALEPLRSRLPRNLPGRRFAARGVFVGGFGAEAQPEFTLQVGELGSVLALTAQTGSGGRTVGAEFNGDGGAMFDAGWVLTPSGPLSTTGAFWLLAEFEEA